MWKNRLFMKRLDFFRNGTALCKLLIVFPNGLSFFRLIVYRITEVRPFKNYDYCILITILLILF